METGHFNLPNISTKSAFGPKASVYGERLSGYANPNKYDQYYINKYSYPKGLNTHRRSPVEIQAKQMKNHQKRNSLFDVQ